MYRTTDYVFVSRNNQIIFNTHKKLSDMKKLLILFAAVALFSCSDTKNSNTTDDKKDTPKDDKPKKELVKKTETEQKQDLKELFDKKKVEEVKTEDKKGWTNERREEIVAYFMQDMEGVPEADAKAFANCQADNLMKIFSSYEEAMSVFNMEDEEEISDDKMNKIETVMDAYQSCYDQMMKKYNEGYDEGEKDDAEESGKKKNN